MKKGFKPVIKDYHIKASKEFEQWYKENKGIIPTMNSKEYNAWLFQKTQT